MEVKLEIGDFELIFTADKTLWIKKDGGEMIRILPVVLEHLLSEYYETTLGL